MIPRKQAPKLIQLIENKREYNNVILVEGARQVGKTTFIRQVLKDLQWPFKEFNLEERKSLCEKIDLTQDFDEFTELVTVEMQFSIGSREVLFIDEAQESQKLGSYVRFMKEKWQHTQVILSGSLLSRIFRDNTRYPVGRITLLHLQPFSFEEFLLAGKQEALLQYLHQSPFEAKTLSQNTHQRLLELLNQYMTVGGLPEVIISYLQQGNWQSVRKEILLGYYSDFKRVYGEGKQAYFIACLKAVANLLGAPFKNTYVAALLDGGKNKEIVAVLGQLEAWKMIYKVDQRGPNVETHFHPKRYLFDLGIAKQLRESVVSDIHLEIKNSIERTPLGGLIENIVAQALIIKTMDLTGWKKSSSGSEVDFVIKHKGKVVPIECKAATKIKNTHLAGLRDFMQRHGAKQGIVVALAPFEIRQLSKKEQIIILPLYSTEQMINYVSD